MITFSTAMVLIGMFMLRVGVPIAVIAGLVYLLKRLDRRWEEEARMQIIAEREAQAAGAPKERPVPAGQARQEAPAAVKPGQVPVAGRDMPGPQLPLGPSPLMQAPLPGMVSVAAGRPCWEARGCATNKMADCAAHQHPEMACWQARLQAEGHMPDECPTCEVFQRYPLM